MNWKRILEDLASLFIYGIVMSAILMIVLSLMIREAQAAPFVTPNMIRRNGLTDAQYELLWSQGKNPQVDQAAARDWIFRASRFQNVTNWLDICGKTNDFARLSFDLQGKNFLLTETNGVLTATNKVLVTNVRRLANEVEGWKTDYNALWWDYNSATNKQTKVADYLWEKSQSGTIIQKQIYIGIHTWYTNFIAQVENAVK